MECVSGLPRFLATPPPSRELFYHNDREVVSPKIRSGEGGGTLVYSNQTSKQKYVSNMQHSRFMYMYMHMCMYTPNNYLLIYNLSGFW